MSYIELINRFWVVHEGSQFSTTEIALYFYLLKLGNLCGWPDSIKRNNAKVQADLGVSYNTLSNARNRLKNAGIVDFRTKNGSPNVAYYLTFSKFDKVTSEVGEEVTIEVTTEVSTEVGGELNKRKEIRKKSKEIIPPISPDAGEPQPKQPLPKAERRKREPFVVPTEEEVERPKTQRAEENGNS